jgi:uncharacterized protein with PhoU and TrkA domain
MAETITIIQNEYATLVYHSDIKVVHHTFHKPIAGQAFRDVLSTGIKVMAEHKASKWLSDDRENAVLPDDDVTWSKEVWFPHALKAGWKYWALVVPQDLLARMNMKQFVDSYIDQGLRVMVFSQPESAMEWLRRSVPQ